MRVNEDQNIDAGDAIAMGEGAQATVPAVQIHKSQWNKMLQKHSYSMLEYLKRFG